MSGRRPIVTALIPVKSLTLGKSRLSGALVLPERIQLTENVLRRLLHLLRGNPDIAATAVVTRDERVRQWLEGRHVRVLEEHGAGLNAALEGARTQLALRPGNALLVLPADLAAISAADIAGIIQSGADLAKGGVVIAPDRHGRGTNALLLHPPDVIPFCFGEGSAEAHAAASAAAGVPAAFWRSESAGLDLDEPEDLERYIDQW
jgi:2-phospho-L-lactate/phosphoenolpyruvate guanylyltransferase